MTVYDITDSAQLTARQFLDPEVLEIEQARDRVLRTDHVLRVITIVGGHPGTESVVRDALQKLPSWTFLRYYATQLISSLDKAEGDTIAAILEQIAVRHLPFPVEPHMHYSSPKIDMNRQI